MNRRQFMETSALLAAGCMAASCAELTPRYARPEKLTQSDQPLLLSNARIVDVERGVLRHERRILLEEGRIARLFGQGEPPGTFAGRELDLNGAYVIPGIINAHCHMSLLCGLGANVGILMAWQRQIERNAEECVKHGVTTVRDMLSVSDWAGELKEKIARGEVTGPRILSCCALEVKGGYGDKMTLVHDRRFHKTANDPNQAHEAVRAAVDQGADFIKIFQQRTELVLPGDELPMMDTATIRAIREEAERLGKVVALHHTERAGLLKGLEAGIRDFQHMARDRDLNDEDIRAFVDTGATVVPTASAPFMMAFESRGDPNWGKEGMVEWVKRRDEILPEMLREFCEPELLGSTMKFYRKYSDPDGYEKRHLVPWPDPTPFTAGVTIGTDNAKRLYEAGARFGCGNDGGIPFAFPGAMGLEMELIETLGAGPAEILRMATSNNARLLRMEDEIGAIREGMVADLVILENNPLETITNAARPLMVFTDGRLAYRA